MLKTLKAIGLALILAFSVNVAKADPTTMDQFQTKLEEAIKSGELVNLTQNVLVGASAKAYVEAVFAANGIVGADLSKVTEVVLLTADNKNGVGVFIVVGNDVYYLGIIPSELHNTIVKAARNGP